jgi:cytochrome c-type biogenesis protein CcmF
VFAGLSLVAGLVFFYIHHGGPVLSIFGLALGFWGMLGAMADLWYRGGFGKVKFSLALRRLAGLPRSAFGTALAHFGLGVTVLGIFAAATFGTETVTEMKPGASVDAGGYTLTFDGMRDGAGPNYTDSRGHFTVQRAGVAVAETWSSKRLYTARRMPTTEAGILTFGLSQLYVSLGDPMADGGIVVRIWWKPFILCIWGGALIMMLGGFVSLSDRRLRVGAPSRRAKTVKPTMEPAE